MMDNLGMLMRKAQEMQEKVKRMREEMDNIEVIGESGGGMVKVTCSGSGTARRVEISPKLFQTEDVATVEDLVTAAINDARVKSQTRMQEAMGKLGVPTPSDMPMPFPFGD